MSRATWLCCGALGMLMLLAADVLRAAESAAAGRLDAHNAKGEALGNCPLKHTDVQVDIAGFIARVTVTQRFHNPYKERIEAIYTFPLSQDAAVDRMEMHVGDRIIKALIQERDEARRTYEQARDAGHLASLLDQERPNIFTQSVANIQPGDAVDVTLSYVETLDWRDGTYQFDFPTVVGPRYMPGTPTGARSGVGTAPPTDKVPDADRISPPVTPAATRAGHDLSISVKLDAGLPIRAIASPLHEIEVKYADDRKTTAEIALRQLKTLPNRDFVLTYQTASDRIEDALLAHTDARGKFFTLVIQPPARVKPEAAVPRELIFVIDNSGSMSGRPIETAKKSMRRCIEELRSEDTFNLITFSGSVSFCFDKPRPNSEATRKQALTFLNTLQGDGGTEMMKAIHACLGGQDKKRLRIVAFMTDGFVGNDMEIIDAVKQHAGVARVFSFGIGTSVNRFLLDGITRAGRGEVQYVLEQHEAIEAANRFAERIHTPVLTDIQLEFQGVDVEQVYPTQLADLFSAQPLVVKGRYKQAAKGKLMLRGKSGAGDFSRVIEVNFPDDEPQHEMLAPLWARARVEELMNSDLAGIQQGRADAEVKREIVALGLNYQLLTQFTSFVAVEATMHSVDGPPKKVGVPVELPEGVSREGIFGAAGGAASVRQTAMQKLNQQRVFLSEFALRERESYALSSIASSSRTASSGGGIDSGLGDGFHASSGGGLGGGFGSRGSGMREPLVSAGGTKQSERSAAASLNWLSRHQSADGSWKFEHSATCRGGTCTHDGKWKSDSAATALGLLPFFAAGQTHVSKGPYQRNTASGVKFLIDNQQITGDLAGEDAERPLLAHALATIVLCEAYGMTSDARVGIAAQSAIDFIQQQQNAQGGWDLKRDGHGSSTTLFCWQVMSLRSAELGGLKVDPLALKRCKAYLRLCVTSEPGQFAESPQGEVTATSTAAGLLAAQLLGAKRTNSAIAAGVKYLQAHPPAAESRDSDYWYFATLVMHRQPGGEWDNWHRQTRRLLIGTQEKSGCASGSWNPEEPNVDAAHANGRLYVTALAALTLEIYYRYLPLYKDVGQP